MRTAAKFVSVFGLTDEGIRARWAVSLTTGGSLRANAESLDGGGEARLGVDVDDRAVEPHVARGHFELGGVGRELRFHDARRDAAENAVVRAGHADVALKGRSAWEDALVGGWNVRMRA